jgi:eukaryotic-like serine/threonine-protein kinase
MLDYYWSLAKITPTSGTETNIFMEGTLLSNRYRLSERLGQGGMGVVYRARDTLLARDVAVKILTLATPPFSDGDCGGDDGHAQSSDRRARLLREAQATAKLNHPNIVAVYDAGESDNPPALYVVMELVEGQSLHQLRPSHWQETIAIARQICLALEQAHANGIIHRDLKLENILVTPSATIKLMDFGLARLNSAPRLTMEGALVGTYAYLAPELIRGGPPTPQSDLYALGIILYELLTGHPPFSGEDVTSILSQHLFAPVAPPSAHNDDTPPILDSLVLRLLDKNPEERPSSASEVLTLLTNIEAGQSDLTAVAGDISHLDRLTRGRLVAREQELAEANAEWQKAVSGEGGVLLISGEPGVGKSRLVQELMVRAEAMRGLALMGECYAEGGAPYAPLIRALQPLFIDEDGRLPTLSEATLNGLITLAPALAERFPHITPTRLGDPAAEQQRLFDSMGTLFDSLTRRKPTLLVIDDVHWADAGSLSMLRYLARLGRRLRLLVVLTYREVELNETRALNEFLNDLNRERLARRIKLNRLSLEQTRDLLAVLFAEEITPAFLEGIYRETEGNPFFVEEVCRALIESGKLYREGGRWQRPETMTDLEIPQSVRVAIQSRVTKLPETAQEFLTLAAIVGRKFTFDTLLAAAETDEDDLIEALEMAEKAQLVNEVGHAGGGEFSFAHALIPTTLAESVSGLRRRRLHRRVAAALERLAPEDYAALAHHYAAAADEERAYQCYRKAGDQALAAFANQDAERFYRAALEFEPPDAVRAPILANMGEALGRQSAIPAAVATMREAIPLYQSLAEYDALARLYARASVTIWYDGRHQAALELCQEGLAAVAGKPETAGTAYLLHEAARACYFADMPDKAAELCARASLLGEQLDLVEIRAQTLITASLLPSTPPHKKKDMLVEAIRLAEAAGLPEAAGRAYNNLTVYCAETGQWELGVAYSRRGIELARRIGFTSHELWHLTGCFWGLLLLARFDEAEGLLSRVDELLASQPSNSLLIGRMRGMQAYLARYRGDFSWMPEMVGWQEEARQRQSWPELQLFCVLLGSAYLELGQLAAAKATLTEAVAISKERLHTAAQSFALLIITLVELGDSENARAVYAEANDKLAGRQSRSSSERLWLQWAEARLAVSDGRWHDAHRLYENLAEEQGKFLGRWWQAATLREWGGALLAEDAPGNRAKAEAVLAEAEAIFTEINIPHYARLARQEREKSELYGES